MKKCVCVIFALLLLLQGCSPRQEMQEAEPKKTFQVGFGRTDITPEDSVPLAGYGNTSKRMSTTLLDYLYATCLAITDPEGETVLLFSQDLVNSSQTERVRQTVSQVTGVPEDHIMVAATHTHSAPDQSSSHENITFWKIKYLESMVKAAELALADRAEASFFAGSTQTEQLNFIRHYLLSDGSYGGSNFGDFANNTIVDHAAQVDAQVQLLKITRSGKKDILLANWQAHPLLSGGLTTPDISADFIGSARSYLEEQTGGYFVYFTGAAGNTNPTSRISEETRTSDHKEYGKLLGDCILPALEQLTALETGDIKLTQLQTACAINHQMEDKLEEAKEVAALYAATDRDTGNVLARQLGFSSVYHANAVIRRAKLEESRLVEMCAVSMGDFSFIAAPYEMFANHGVYIKENTPFSMTFVISCCNGAQGYIPSAEAYDYGCYESHTGNFTRETGDILAAEYVAMLKKLQ